MFSSDFSVEWSFTMFHYFAAAGGPCLLAVFFCAVIWIIKLIVLFLCCEIKTIVVMTKKEFEKLIKVPIISDNVWSDVQRVFDAAGASDWAAFARSYSDMGVPDWELCKALTFEVERLRAALEPASRRTAMLDSGIALTLVRAAAKYKDKTLFDAAEVLVGLRSAVALYVSEDLVLPAESLEYIKDNLK